jgi:putative nucleotide binding protein
MKMVVPAKREEEAIVLDFLQNGYSFDTRPMHLKTPIAQALGTDRFTVLELVPKKDIHLQPRAKVYIGDQKRDEIHHVNGKIGVDKLTATAQSELPHAIKAIIDMDQQKFVDFFNKAQPISIRTHSLELLPGIGKKHMQEILEARRDRDFDSFDDIKARVKLIMDPEKLIINRILNEIKGQEKHHLFVAPPATEEDEKRDSRPPRRDFDGPRRF